jgi:branched-chain amino acid transport system permease protein
VAAYLIGAVVLRFEGDLLALVTFGFATIVYSIALNWRAVTRGPMGLPGLPQYELCSLSPSWLTAALTLAVVSISLLALFRMVRAPYGRLLAAIREDEIVTLSFGKNVTQAKRGAFVFAGFLAGIAGALYAHYVTYIDPSSFRPLESVTILLMVILGGCASLRGSFVGPAVVILLPEALRLIGLPSSVAAPTRQMLFGLVLILLVLKRPQGLFGKRTMR